VLSVTEETDAEQEQWSRSSQQERFELLYRRFAPMVLRLATRLLGSAADAEDAAHEVFLVAHRRLPELERSEHLETWLRRVTLHMVQQQRRRRRWRPWLVRLPELPDLVMEGISPAALLQQRQTVEQIHRTLAQLKERHRTVLVLFELEGLSGEELSALLGVKVETLWVWLHRARAAFLQQLQADKGDP
jgi:RNA polymerase sigma-70 factor (ECF subfamily)